MGRSSILKEEYVPIASADQQVKVSVGINVCKGRCRSIAYVANAKGIGGGSRKAWR